ncbi:unnamed protein product [Caenorhabditis auriculariae]|uniref:Uncharacterized protein n=1 Tax=Caenorhabditis auriculariae TaxID=2777116 RepID=A0A8S1HVW7_9PELO|nr:unnamed protein product [Caenorhabditis auriculariae]
MNQFVRRLNVSCGGTNFLLIPFSYRAENLNYRNLLNADTIVLRLDSCNHGLLPREQTPRYRHGKGKNADGNADVAGFV